MKFENIYFLGIGGIGMSAIARYFLHEGKRVAGYDKTATPLTEALVREGATIHYEDAVDHIPAEFKDVEKTLVVYTPAIPANHIEFNWMKTEGFEMRKRSNMLGVISKGKYVMAIAGTHGKTSVTTLTAWLNRVAGGGGSAFLGGISRNFESNMVLGSGDRLAVEADEFDRSFLQLYPNVAIITSADADHLDIYGTHEKVKEAFSQFVSQIKGGGALIINDRVDIEIPNSDIDIYRYSYDKNTEFYAENIELIEGGCYRYDIVCPDRKIVGCELGVPGWINVENSVAAVAALWVAGFENDELLREGLKSFEGIKRRFELYVNTPNGVYMDDYAHHPRELEVAITSVRKMFPDRGLTVIFQPHLYSRTQDFHVEFAKSLSLADRVALLPIYPARELPIEGVSSEMISKLVTPRCEIVTKESLVKWVEDNPNDIVVTFGAGDIDMYCGEIAKVISDRSEN